MKYAEINIIKKFCIDVQNMKGVSCSAWVIMMMPESETPEAKKRSQFGRRSTIVSSRAKRGEIMADLPSLQPRIPFHFLRLLINFMKPNLLTVMPPCRLYFWSWSDLCLARSMMCVYISSYACFDEVAWSHMNAIIMSNCFVNEAQARKSFSISVSGQCGIVVCTEDKSEILSQPSNGLFCGRDLLCAHHVLQVVET